MSAIRSYIGIGSNLQDPLAQVKRALRALDRIPQSRCVARSSLYRSDPVGPPGQTDYINAVAALETELAVDELLCILQAIETAQGRVRNLRWGPRTLDLDILVCGELIQDNPHLTIPHPRLHERAFVLYPLYEIAPDLIVPGRGDLKTLMHACPPLGLEQLAGQG